MFVFALHDSAVKAFAQPFFMPTENAAIRAFRALVNDPKSTVNQSPGDYTLHYLGAFDDTHGTFTTDQCPRQIASGIAVYAPSIDPAQRPLPGLDGNGAFNSEAIAP